MCICVSVFMNIFFRLLFYIHFIKNMKAMTADNTYKFFPIFPVTWLNDLYIVPQTNKYKNYPQKCVI